MPYGLYLSAAGANAQNHRLQVVSHNLANVATPGFKPEEAILQARFAEAIERNEKPPGTTAIDDVGGGVTIQPAQTRHIAGKYQTTGNDLDFAINDPSMFFVIQHDGEQILTKAGNFVFDNLGRLVTPTGQTVMAVGGAPLQIDPRLPYDVAPGGVIRQGDNRFMLQIAKPKEMGGFDACWGKSVS